jgi:hypothetical protein
MWQTPVSDDAVNRAKGKVNSRGEPKLSAQAKMWPTPTLQDAKNATQPPSQKDRDHLPGALMREGISGSLNPAWVEWLMGFPEGWTDLKHSETP